MLKINDQRNSREPITMRAGDIPTGTVFEGDFCGKRGVFIRIGESSCTIVSLSEPRHDWQDAHNKRVENYRPLNATLVIEREDR